MSFPVTRNRAYDFSAQQYADSFPNLHRYPAAMIPQIAIAILDELQITSGSLLDPYCGSGSTLIAGAVRGLNTLSGFDINPFAVLLARAKFLSFEREELEKVMRDVRMQIYDCKRDKDWPAEARIPHISNILYWYSKPALRDLSLIKYCIDRVLHRAIRDFLLVSFREGCRSAKRPVYCREVCRTGL